jgi:hypothetical protein
VKENAKALGWSPVFGVEVEATEGKGMARSRRERREGIVSGLFMVMIGITKCRLST